jgi:hypothetical protein
MQGVGIDPEVAALLDDLPPITLPPALVAEGWGQRSLKKEPWLGGMQRKPTEGSQQPTYTDNCVQCGRPITMNRRQMWTDHAGRKECENVLLDEPVLDYHVTQHDLDVGWRTVQEYPPLVPVKSRGKFRDLPRKKDEPPKPAMKCSATKFGGHMHQCWHPGDHFGFHECVQCRHLWR